MQQIVTAFPPDLAALPDFSFTALASDEHFASRAKVTGQEIRSNQNPDGQTVALRIGDLLSRHNHEKSPIVADRAM